MMIFNHVSLSQMKVFSFLLSLSSHICMSRSFSKKAVLLWRCFISSHKGFFCSSRFKNHSNSLIGSSPFPALCLFENLSEVSFGKSVLEIWSPKMLLWCTEDKTVVQEAAHDQAEIIQKDTFWMCLRRIYLKFTLCTSYSNPKLLLNEWE